MKKIKSPFQPLEDWKVLENEKTGKNIPVSYEEL